MKPERWSQIGKLFEAASSMPAALRAEWLRNASGDDESLRAEVEHLLAHDSQADRDGFLDQPEVANRGLSSTGLWPPEGTRQNRRVKWPFALKSPFAPRKYGRSRLSRLRRAQSSRANDDHRRLSLLATLRTTRRRRLATAATASLRRRPSRGTGGNVRKRKIER